MDLKTTIIKTLLSEQVAPIDLNESMEVAQKVMSKSGAHIGTVYKYDKPNVVGYTHGASYHPHGKGKPAAVGDWRQHHRKSNAIGFTSESDAVKHIHQQHDQYKTEAKKALEKAQKHKDSIPD